MLSAEPLYRAVKFIGYHCCFTAVVAQCFKQGQDTWIRGGLILHVLQIVSLEPVQAIQDQPLVRAGRHSPADELFHAVAHELPDLLQRTPGQSEVAQRTVGAGRQVTQGIQQRTVQVKDHRVITHHASMFSFAVALKPAGA